MTAAPPPAGSQPPSAEEGSRPSRSHDASTRCAVFLCRCGDIIPSGLDLDLLADKTRALDGVAAVHSVGFLCSEDGLAEMRATLESDAPARVVVAACSPKEHEETFRAAASAAGLNPYHLQMANIREQVAWVTPSREEATAKASRMVGAAVARVAHHAPLAASSLPVTTDALVVGAGPAGLKAALTLAEAGRRVTLVEKGPAIGGHPVLYEEVFPNLECGPCMLEPLMDRVIHGELSERIELLTLAEVDEVVGSFGNFTATIRQRARFVDEARCIGCGMCAEACPAPLGGDAASHGARKAISFPFPGALPNLPELDPVACLRFEGGACAACAEACPVEDAIRFSDAETLHERSVGSVIVATGFDLYDPSELDAIEPRPHPRVLTHFEAERAMASNGMSGGVLPIPPDLEDPAVTIVHCVGSLDPERRNYCSGTCCQEALKLNRMITHRHPGARITHLYRNLVLHGKGAGALLTDVETDGTTHFARTRDFAAMEIRGRERDGVRISYVADDGAPIEHDADLVILCTAMVPGRDAPALGRKLGITLDADGFFRASHERSEPVWSNVRGVYLAGSCQAPGDIRAAMASGMAAAGQALAALVEGRELVISPLVASVDEGGCSGCGICVGQCPYKAIRVDIERRVAEVSATLCRGCGTCVAACPSGAMAAAHFTDAQIRAEVSALAM